MSEEQAAVEQEEEVIETIETEEETTVKVDEEGKEIVEPVEPTEEEQAAAKVKEEADDAIIKKAIADGKVVEYDRFKGVYGAGKRTERELEELRSSKPETKLSPATDRPEPKEDDFESFAEYENAKLDWKLDQRDAARNAERQESDAKTQKEESFKKIDDKVSAAIAKDPKFFEKAWIPNEFAELLADSDHFAEFGYYFAENKSEIDRLLKMSPNRAAMEIGKLEASFKMPKPKTTTNAPTPTKPLGGSSAVTKQPKDMSYDEHVAWREGGGGKE
ncbi:hypothetical protein KAR91_37975 [Candidatus Pacearchaeota archaeon]|nr:hypothetical protein [Candidatus Pacearchaeota archaeon]